jgi:hypothetical protein
MQNKEFDKPFKTMKDITLEYHNWFEFMDFMKTFQLAKFGEAGDEIISAEKIDWFSRKPSPIMDSFMTTSTVNLLVNTSSREHVDLVSTNNSSTITNSENVSQNIDNIEKFQGDSNNINSSKKKKKV